MKMSICVVIVWAWYCRQFEKYYNLYVNLAGLFISNYDGGIYMLCLLESQKNVKPFNTANMNEKLSLLDIFNIKALFQYTVPDRYT